jgi:hypothetical protein
VTVISDASISDASPLISLARIDELELLPELYNQIAAPEAVWEEVVEGGERRPGAEKSRMASWIERQEVENRALVRRFAKTWGSERRRSLLLVLIASQHS